MKSFFKTLLATILGIIVSVVLLFVLFIAIISGIVASQNKPPVIKNNSILYIKLDLPIVDREPATTVNLGSFGMENQLGLNQILSSINYAKSDSRIKGIYIEPMYANTGYATIDEIRDALADFRESGKFVVSYSEIFTQKGYYLATASDKIFFNPTGIFMLNGLRIKSQFYKNTFEKLGIEPVVVKMGKYKGATESFEEEKMTAPNKEQLNALVGSIWSSISKNICLARGIEKDTLDKIINNLSVSLPDKLSQYKLVDSLVYKSDVLDYLKQRTSTPFNKDLSSVKISDYSKLISQSNIKPFGGDKIAVIYASGAIYDGENDGDNIGGETIAREIRLARRDSTIKAIVLRVNSPGGSSLASEVITDEIKRTSGIKPIVVSMGDMAASGGYYISCLADSVLSGKSTITGSIGVFFRAAYANGFFDKLGITFDMVKTHDHADIFSFTRPYSDTELEFIKQSISRTYDMFLERVATGRNMGKDAVNEIAQGRVWSGADAQDIGLVDSFGGLEDAIDAARYLAGVDEKCQVIELPKQETALEKLFKDLSGESKVKSSLEGVGIDKTTFTQLEQLFKLQGMVSIVPYALDLQ